jgi:hypothetical protein
MWFVTMTAPDEITTRSDLSNEALLSAVEDTATDHAMIDADLAAGSSLPGGRLSRPRASAGVGAGSGGLGVSRARPGAPGSG